MEDNIQYDDKCINFNKSGKNVLKYLPDDCYILIGGECEDKNNNYKIEQYICNKKLCKRTRIKIESLFDLEIGEDVSEETFNQTKLYDGSDFYDKIIEIE